MHARNPSRVLAIAIFLQPLAALAETTWLGAGT